tara:strand:- start:41 stop:508 length:468 start_codon:yes stop_codon:yes gene_type:complete
MAKWYIFQGDNFTRCADTDAIKNGAWYINDTKIEATDDTEWTNVLKGRKIPVLNSGKNGIDSYEDKYENNTAPNIESQEDLMFLVQMFINSCQAFITWQQDIANQKARWTTAKNQAQALFDGTTFADESYPITNKTLSEWLSENGVTDYSGLLIP